MIKCEYIDKIYGEEVVIENYTHEFNDTGFYLLFGESGSGKTTFLNVLAGLLSYEKGKVVIDGNEYENIVDKEYMAQIADYITQDTFFVDFLDILDNLKMINNDEDAIKSNLDRFGLLSKLKEYPSKLSGGEKQRFAIVRSLMNGKRVLLLDEPTASLDVENKIKVFELLSKIKDEVLIICSSHDQMAMDYADEIIKFEKLHSRKLNKEEVKEEKNNEKKYIVTEATAKKNKLKISYFLRKWFLSKRKSKVSGSLFYIFLTLAMCMCMLADTPQNRLNSNIEYLYKVNMCILRTYDEDPGEYQRLCEIDGVKEVILDYGWCLPIDDESGMEGVSITYEYNVPVLPSSKEAFKLSDKIKYGSYFTDRNQIILSAEMAESLMGNEAEKLIGQTLEKEFYGIGKVELEIVGIFDYFNDFEKEYMRAMGVNIAKGKKYNKGNYESLWYINGDFMSQYVDDTEFYAGNQRSYTIYFDSYSTMKKYYDDNVEMYDERGDFLLNGLSVGNKLGLFDLLYKVFMPLSYFVALFSIIFYINLTKTELTYNNKFISVMDYAGYKVKKVVNTFILLNWMYLIKICSLALVSALALTKFLNVINEKFIFIEFRIFTYNITMLLIFIGVLLMASIVFTYAFLRKFKKINWYENIIENRDLL